jgi:hypothetical protein
VIDEAHSDPLARDTRLGGGKFPADQIGLTGLAD